MLKCIWSLKIICKASNRPDVDAICLTRVLPCRNSVDFYHRKCTWPFTKEYVPFSNIVVKNAIHHNTEYHFGKKLIIFDFTLHPGYYMSLPPHCVSMWIRCCGFCYRKQVHGKIIILCWHLSSNNVCHHFHPVLLIYSCNQSLIHIFLCKQYTLMH